MLTLKSSKVNLPPHILHAIFWVCGILHVDCHPLQLQCNSTNDCSDSPNSQPKFTTCDFKSLKNCLFVGFVRPLTTKTCHTGRWLTSVKFQYKVDVHWFNKLFWPISAGRILQPQKWLEICKCQRTITPHQRSTICFAGNELAFVHVTICILSGNSGSVFWEIQAHTHTASRFPY